ncbi:MAG: isoamylase early set domain-containing protein [Deltaproteobacteria bacterium]
MLLFGAGFPACVTTTKTQGTAEVSVSFVLSGQHDSVCLSADFNGWSSESHCLERDGDRWWIQVVLPPGSYRYGFVIDKTDWTWDPEALIQEEDGFGKKNSVLIINPAVTKTQPGP